MMRTFTLLIILLGAAAPSASAAERLCDPAFENCRTPLIDLIRNETVGIDVSFWFMEDSRYATELINRFTAGIPVRVIIDPCANKTYPLNKDMLDRLQAAGIPMRQRIHTSTCGGAILHFKMMLFAGQQTVQFSGANYSPNAFVPNDPYKDYVDEAIYFSDDPAVVNSFKTKFDDRWTNTTRFSDYANITSTPVRNYPTFSIDPELQFSPEQSYASRATKAYDAETQKIDVIMYRITHEKHTKAIIAARNRGIPVRLLTEQVQYRLPERYWHSYNVDQMYMAGVQIKHRGHLGLNHQKSILLYSQGLSIFGSSNWTGPSDQSQEEHNYFTKKVWIFQWLQEQFERKWNNSTGHTETIPFEPLPPDRPTIKAPANAAITEGTDVTLIWNGGLYAHKFDVFLDTSPTPTTRIARIELNTIAPPKNDPKFDQTMTVTGLAPGTTYYWQVVGETMAAQRKAGPIYSFTTGGPVLPPPTNATLGPGDVLVHVGARAIIPAGSGWRVAGDATAAGGSRAVHPDAGAPKLAEPLANPTHYLEVPVTVQAGIAYRLWIRAKAEKNGWANDSVFVQSDGTVDSAGNAVYRIGTTSATEVNLEECKGCGLSEWGWQDNGWGNNVLGPTLYFAQSATYKLRIQTREDGLSIDQVMLSPEKFLSTRPGSNKDDATIYPESSSSTTTATNSTAPPPSGTLGTGDVLVYAGVHATVPPGSGWRIVDDADAAGGKRIAHPDAGMPKASSPLADPTHYFEIPITVDTGIAYRLWLRGRAENDGWANDSVFVQSSATVDAAGNAIYRIGTTSAADVNLEECKGCGLAAWGWQDNGWGVDVLGPPLHFESGGTHTLRIQTREDGLTIDQILLSPDKFLTTRPGLAKNDATIYPESSPAT